MKYEYNKNVLNMDCHTQDRLKLVIELYRVIQVLPPAR
jgi:hypothetical protein